MSLAIGPYRDNGGTISKKALEIRKCSINLKAQEVGPSCDYWQSRHNKLFFYNGVGLGVFHLPLWMTVLAVVSKEQSLKPVCRCFVGE